MRAEVIVTIAYSNGRTLTESACVELGERPGSLIEFRARQALSLIARHKAGQLTPDEKGVA